MFDFPHETVKMIVGYAQALLMYKNTFYLHNALKSPLGKFGDREYTTQYIVSHVLLNTIYCGLCGV